METVEWEEFYNMAKEKVFVRLTEGKLLQPGGYSYQQIQYNLPDLFIEIPKEYVNEEENTINLQGLVYLRDRLSRKLAIDDEW